MNQANLAGLLVPPQLTLKDFFMTGWSLSIGGLLSYDSPLFSLSLAGHQYLNI